MATPLEPVQRPSWLLPADPRAGAARLQQLRVQQTPQPSPSTVNWSESGKNSMAQPSLTDSVADRKRERNRFMRSVEYRLGEVSQNEENGSSFSEIQASSAIPPNSLWQQAKSGAIQPSRSPLHIPNEAHATIPVQITRVSPQKDRPQSGVSLSPEPRSEPVDWSRQAKLAADEPGRILREQIQMINALRADVDSRSAELKVVTDLNTRLRDVLSQKDRELSQKERQHEAKLKAIEEANQRERVELLEAMARNQPMFPVPRDEQGLPIYADRAVDIELRLQMNMADIPNPALFRTEVIADLASAAGVDPRHIELSALRAGSVVVEATLAAEARDAKGHAAMQIARNLEEQARHSSSALRQGKHTSKTISLIVLGPSRLFPPPRQPTPPRSAERPPAGILDRLAKSEDYTFPVSSIDGLDEPFAELSRALGLLSRLQAELSDRTQGLERALAANEELAADRRRVRDENLALATRLSRVEEDFERAVREHREREAELQRQLDEERAKVRELMISFAAVETQYRACMEENARLLRDNEDLRAQVRRLTEENARLERELKEALEENAALARRNAELEEVNRRNVEALRALEERVLAETAAREREWLEARSRRDARIAELEAALRDEREALRQAQLTLAAYSESYRLQVAALTDERDRLLVDSVRWEREKKDLEAELRAQRAEDRARLEEAVAHHAQALALVEGRAGRFEDRGERLAARVRELEAEVAALRRELARPELHA